MRTLVASQYLSASTAGFGMAQKNNNFGGLNMKNLDIEEKEQEKLHRKRMRRFYLLRAKWYLKKAFEDIMQGILV